MFADCCPTLARTLHVLGVLILVAMTACPSDAGETITGRAQVIDGDGLSVSAREIRLHGINAP
jgi:endonuclease YncB( thermonuclease family)